MANHGYGTFTKRQTNESEIWDLLEEANEKYFKGMLEIVYYSEDDFFNVFVDSNFTEKERVFQCWLNDDGTQLEFRHGHATTVAWWIDGFLSSYIVDRIGGYITDDGHGEIADPDFYKRLPTYKAYLFKRTSFIPSAIRRFANRRWTLRMDYEYFPKGFMNLIMGK